MQSKYRAKFDEKLSLSPSTDLDVQWGYIRNALYSSAEQTCGSAVMELDPWISTHSVNLICKRRNIAPGTTKTRSWNKKQSSSGSWKLVASKSWGNGVSRSLRKQRKTVSIDTTNWLQDDKSIRSYRRKRWLFDFQSKTPIGKTGWTFPIALLKLPAASAGFPTKHTTSFCLDAI